MIKSIVLLKSFAQLDYTVCFVRDGCLIPVDRWIPIGCNTFLWAPRASSHDVSTIKKLIEIFLLTCNWPIRLQSFSMQVCHDNIIICPPPNFGSPLRLCGWDRDDNLGAWTCEA